MPATARDLNRDRRRYDEDEVETTAKDVTIQRKKGVKQIILPEGMPLKEAAEWIVKKDKEEDKVINIYYEIECFPLDGALALREALEELYGFVSQKSTWGNPPTMVGVPVSATETVQIPWGRVQIPGIFGHLETTMTPSYPKFIITGQTKQRHLYEINEIVDFVKKHLKNKSIYKGKAIRLDLSWIREGYGFDPFQHAPAFTIPTDKIKEDELVFPDKVQNDIELGLFTPIEQSEFCRSHQIPLKRGVLLAGDYGTGKTLAAYVTAKKAVENGWTFIYLSNVLDLALGFKFAAQYAPAVIFSEDVDRVVGQVERTEEIDAVLNAFDGVDTKNVEVITVLTTNHLEKLSQAILRPGRCDTLVEVTRPDQAAAARLVKLYGRGLIAESADFKKIGEALAGHLPAEIREAVERAKLAAISRLTKSGHLKKGGTIQGHVQEDDVLAAVHAMESQHKLLERRLPPNQSVVEQCATIIGDRIGSAVSGHSEVVLNLLQQLGHKADDLTGAAEDLDSANDLQVAGNGKPH